MNDVDAFGSFMNAFVVALRDEYPKLTSVIFPVMSNSTSQTLDIYDVRSQLLTAKRIHSHAASGTENGTALQRGNVFAHAQ
jgi:hypothetical protein